MRECPVCRRCFTDDVDFCPTDGDATINTIVGEPILDKRYQLEKRLGQGGMGAVFKARHVFLKTLHAIKVILPDLVGNDPQLVTRFRQEALASAAIRHPNVISVTDYGVERDTMPFLVMEFVNGRSLHEIIAAEGAMSPERAYEIIAASCAGVSAAHKQSIIHRDLKPLNIMIQDGMSVAEGLKVLDFGLAKIKSGELLGSFVQAQTQGLMGSPYYMAPEQWSDEDPDARADLYSLGIIFYQMLGGDVPFKGAGIPSIMKKHLTEMPPPLVSLGANVPPELEAVIHHALAKERENRPPSVEHFLEEIRVAMGYSSGHLGSLSSGVADGVTKTSIYLKTLPVESAVTIDQNYIGRSDEHGYIILENIPPGTYTLKVNHNGFLDWSGEVECPGGEFHLEVALERSDAEAKTVIDGAFKDTGDNESGTGAATMMVGAMADAVGNVSARFDVGKATQRIARPGAISGSNLGSPTVSPQNPAVFSANRTAALGGGNGVGGAQTVALSDSQIGVGREGKKSSKLLPIAAVAALALGGGGFAVYKFVVPSASVVENSNNLNANNKDGGGNQTGQYKAELVAIPGGKFQMGRNSGTLPEQPAHLVEVVSFKMDKTEVTNGEYAAFVAATKHTAPSHFVNDKPLSGQENLPVVNVSVADAEAFAAWRGKRDGVTYRLPTEAEWEYAARNGDQESLYPWGNKPEGRNAATKEAEVASLQSVGAYPNGRNRWGVDDLIGNVFEWTSTKANIYPGNNQGVIPPEYADWRIARGGGITSSLKGGSPMSSCWRNWFAPDLKEPILGFRLVQSGS